MSVMGVDAAMTLFNRFRKEASAACSGVSNALGSKREVMGTKIDTTREHGSRGTADGEDSIFEMVQSTLRRRCRCSPKYSTQYSILIKGTFVYSYDHISVSSRWWRNAVQGYQRAQVSRSSVRFGLS